MLPADLHHRTRGVAFFWGFLAALVVLVGLGIAAAQVWGPGALLYSAGGVLGAIVITSWILMTGR